MTLAWLFTDEFSPGAEAVLENVSVAGAIVPSLWRIEIANTLTNAMHRGRSDGAFIARAIEELQKLPIEEDGQTGNKAWSETMALAQEERLTVYDATYLELAVRRGLALGTGDKALMVAARNRGVEVLAP